MDIVLVVISLLVLASSACLYRIASGEPIWRLNMLNLSFMLLLPLSFLGSVLVVIDEPILGYDPERMRDLFRGVTDPRLRVWAAVMWAFLGIPLGGIFANVVRGRRGNTAALMRSFREAPLHTSLRLNERSLFVLSVGVSALLISLLILWLPGQTAFTTLLTTGDVVAAQVTRRSSYYGSGLGIVDVVVNIGVLQWLNLVALTMALVRGGRKWWSLFGIGCLSIVYISLTKGTISHVVFYGLSLAFVRSMVGGRFIRWSEALLGAAAVSLLFALFKGAEGSIVDILSHAVYNRIVFGQMVGTYLAMDIFPRTHEFIWLQSTGRFIHEVLGADYLPSYGIILMRIYNPAGVAAGSAGHLTTIFLGEAWANFGVLGVVLAPVWIGVVVQLVNRWFIVRRKTVILLAFYGYLSIVFEYASGFMGFYYPVGTVLFVVSALGLVYLARFGLAPRRKVWVSGRRRGQEALANEADAS